MVKEGGKMERFLAYPPDQILFIALALLPGFALHEFAHAYTAWRFGDPTAKRKGRVTLRTPSPIWTLSEPSPSSCWVSAGRSPSPSTGFIFGVPAWRECW